MTHPRRWLQVSSGARRRGLVGLVAAAGLSFVVLLPEFGDAGDLFLWETVAVAILFALSTNLLIGHAGIPSFGQAAFFGIGAYSVGVLSSRGWPVLGVLLFSVLIAVVVAGAFGAATSRTRGIAFSMVTLALGQAFYTIAFHNGALGGENGLEGINRGSLFALDLRDQTVFWFFTAGCTAIGALVLRVVVASPFGHVLHAIRDEPTRAVFLGIDTRKARVGAFAIAGATASAAGALFAYADQIVTPDVLYWTHSGDPIIMSVLGGVGSFWGPAAGAVAYTFLTKWISDATQASVLYIGLVFLLFVILLPGGLASIPKRGRAMLARWHS